MSVPPPLFVNDAPLPLHNSAGSAEAHHISQVCGFAFYLSKPVANMAEMRLPTNWAFFDEI
jgi:hypothetical protein